MQSESSPHARFLLLSESKSVSINQANRGESHTPLLGAVALEGVLCRAHVLVAVGAFLEETKCGDGLLSLVFMVEKERRRLLFDPLRR